MLQSQNFIIILHITQFIKLNQIGGPIYIAPHIVVPFEHSCVANLVAPSNSLALVPQTWLWCNQALTRHTCIR